MALWLAYLVVPAIAAAQGGSGVQAAPAERLREVEEAAAKGAAIVRQLEEKRAAVLDSLERLERSRRAAEAEAARARGQVAESQAALSKARYFTVVVELTVKGSVYTVPFETVGSVPFVV